MSEKSSDCGVKFGDLLRTMAVGLVLGLLAVFAWRVWYKTPAEQGEMLRYYTQPQNVRHDMSLLGGMLATIFLFVGRGEGLKVVTTILALCILNVVGFFPFPPGEEWKELGFEVIDACGVRCTPEIFAGVWLGIFLFVSFSSQKAKFTNLLFTGAVLAALFVGGFLSNSWSDQRVLSIGERIQEGLKKVWEYEVGAATRQQNEAVPDTVASNSGKEVKAKKPDSLPSIPILAGKEISRVDLQVIGPRTEQAEMAFLNLVFRSWKIKPTEKILGEYRKLQKFYSDHQDLFPEDKQARAKRADLLSQSMLKPGPNGKAVAMFPSEESHLNEHKKLRDFLARVPYKD